MKPCVKLSINKFITYYGATYVRSLTVWAIHDDVIKWKHFPRNWPFVRKIHRSPVNFLHKGQWRGALMFSLIYAWINDWANNRKAGDLRRYPVHYDVIVMWCHLSIIRWRRQMKSFHVENKDPSTPYTNNNHYRNLHRQYLFQCQQNRIDEGLISYSGYSQIR